MLNYNTIISSFDDKVTLMKWLKIVDKNLKNGSATTFKVNKKGNATISFSIVFADGSEIESGYIVLQQGESVESASIVNGHLILTLTNETQIDAGDIKPISSIDFNASRHLIVTYGDGTTQDVGLIKGVSSFSINASQHLIVTYDNGTTEDLGAIFSGNVNISGNLTADSIIENMSALYRFVPATTAGLTINNVYCSAVKNGNKLTIVQFFKITRTADTNYGTLGSFQLPSDVASKLYPTPLGVVTTALSSKVIQFFSDPQVCVDIKTIVRKGTNSIENFGYGLTALTLNTEYQARIETTFLLADNLAS